MLSVLGSSYYDNASIYLGLLVVIGSVLALINF
uniref:Uncharacterized protein n=1 Tax=Podoviridae sp. ct8Lf7 TaxID=2827723 RepID=A0A8S5S106_9CAUD|nr:MAG TPA: hypothetical protein [Podoviridae sp. ct8Lf7]